MQGSFDLTEAKIANNIITHWLTKEFICCLKNNVLLEIAWHIVANNNDKTFIGSSLLPT